MTSKRVPLALTLGAFLFVTAGFGATKKSQRNNEFQDWNDVSLQNGSLLAARSSLSSGSSGFQSSGVSRSFRLVSHPWHPQHR